MTSAPCRARCFGTDWLSDIALDQFDAGGAAALGANAIHVSRADALPDAVGGRQQGRLTVTDNGLHFRWNREADFHIADARTIRWKGGLDWIGAMPVAFYSTVAALVLALAGRVPMHASSVIVGGRAWLMAGDAGAGKSTLAAELVAAGYPLLADDLTMLVPDSEGGCVAVRGRPAMRLHVSAAEWLPHVAADAIAGDARGKWLVRPVSRAADQAWPVGGVILLRDKGALSSTERVGALAAAQFRPRIMAALPEQGQRRAALLRLASAVPMISLPPVSGFAPDDQARRVDVALAAIARAAAAP